MPIRYALRTPRNTIMGIFDTEDDAMRSAQDAGGVIPAREDEGGPSYGVLAPGWTIEKLVPLAQHQPEL